MAIYAVAVLCNVVIVNLVERLSVVATTNNKGLPVFRCKPAKIWEPLKGMTGGPLYGMPWL